MSFLFSMRSMHKCAMEVHVNAENPPGDAEIPPSEACESVAKDSQTPISQEDAKEFVRSPIESEKIQEAGLPESKIQLTRPSGLEEVTLGTLSAHPQGERTETLDLGEKEIVGENTGKKRANESHLESSIKLEPDLKCPRLEASCGVSEVVIEINEENPNPQSAETIESCTLKEENPTEPENSVARGNYQDHDFIIQLIEAVKDHRGLYDKNRSIFYDENQDWTAIAEKLKSTKIYCKSKFASLCEQFDITHEVLCNQTKESVTDLKKDFPSFPYYEDLLFLKQCTSKTKTWGNRLNCSTPFPTWLESKEDPSKPVTTNIFREKLLELEKEAKAKQLLHEVTETKFGDEERKADSETETDLKTPTESGSAQTGDKIPVGGFFGLVNAALKIESQNYNTKLIKAVKEHPCIYDRTNEYYSNLLFTTTVWDSIAQKLGKTREECMKTFEYLSQRFAQTHAMLQNHKFARQNFCKVRFPYYDDLLFLNDHVNLTEGQDSGNEVKGPGSSRPIHPYNTRSQPIVNNNNRRRGKNNQQNDQKGASNRGKYQWNRYQNEFNLIQPHFVHPGLPPPIRQPWILMPQNKFVPEAVQTLTQENRTEADDKVIVIENSDDSNSVGAATRAEFTPENDLIVQLIQAVKGYPCLYDQNNEHFTNEGHLEAWTEISKKLQKRREECQAVYESLYRKFVQTYAMLQDPELVKQGFSKNSFEHYDEMRFLENSINIEELQSHVKTIKETSAKATLFPLLQQQYLDSVGKSPRVRFRNRSRPYMRNPEVKPQTSAPLLPKSENVPSSQVTEEKPVPPCSSGSSHPINVPECQEKPPAMENCNEAPNHSHIDFFFKSFCEQVKRANLSDRDFVQMQITMMTALSNTLSQERN